MHYHVAPRRLPVLVLIAIALWMPFAVAAGAQEETTTTTSSTTTTSTTSTTSTTTVPTCPDGNPVPDTGGCEPAPCPDGVEMCGTIRSCAVDTPLPPGAQCEQELVTTTTVRVAAPPSGNGGNVLGRPTGVLGEVERRAPAPAPAPAPVARRQPLARTGWTTDGAIVGTVLVAAGILAVALSRRRASADV